MLRTASAQTPLHRMPTSSGGDLRLPDTDAQISTWLMPSTESTGLVFQLRVTGPGITWTIPSRSIRFRLLDRYGRPAIGRWRITLPAGTPRVIEPTPGPDARFALTFDRGTVRPGLYALRASLRVEAQERGTGRRFHLQELTTTLRVNVPPRPDRRPSLTPGQRFLFIAAHEPSGVRPPYPYREAGSGADVPWSVMEGRTLTLKQVRRLPGGQSLLVFSIEGFSRTVRLTWATGSASFPYLYALTEDVTLRRLRTKFEGKRVWWYGGAATWLRCPGGSRDESVSIRTDVPTSFLIHRLFRISGVGFQLAMRGGETALDWSKSAFAATDPLVVELRAPRDMTVTGWATSGKKRLNLQECTAFQVIFADDWHIQRVLSLAHPGTLHPMWPRAMLSAVLTGDLCKGMSPDMVAWARGLPDDPGTFAEMRRWTAWRYDHGPPFDAWIYFRNGRVADWYFPNIDRPANTGKNRKCA